MALWLRALQPPEEREPAPAREVAAPREQGPREAPREGAGREGAAREGSGREGAGREGSGGGKRGRGERDDREEYNRFSGGRQPEEPRFNAFGEAYSAAKRNKRDRRNVED